MLTITRDDVLDVAYIRLSDKAVARTVEYNDDVVIDLDADRMVVGIELLSQQAEIPFGELVSDYHVHSQVVDLLRLIRPSVAAFAALTAGRDGYASAAQPSSVTTAGC